MENYKEDMLQEDGAVIEITAEDMEMDTDSMVGQTIHLVLDDESEMDTIIIAAYETASYPWTYIALLPLTEEEIDAEDSEVFLYRIQIDEDGSPILGAIESDEEYDAAAEAFYQEMEKMEEECE